MPKKQEWDIYLKQSLYAAKKAVTEFNNLFEEQRVEQFIINIHIALNRLFIAYLSKNKMTYKEENGKIKSFTILVSACYKPLNSLFNKDVASIFLKINNHRNEIEHRLPSPEVANTKDVFIFLSDVLEYYSQIILKISSKYLFKENIIGRNEFIAISDNWLLEDIKELTQNRTVIKATIKTTNEITNGTAIVIKEKEFVFDPENNFQITKAAKEVAKKILGFKTNNMTHITMVHQIFVKNYRKVNYKNHKDYSPNEKYAICVLEKRLLNKKFIDDVILICQNKENWKEFYEKKYKERENIDIDSLLNSLKVLNKKVWQ